MTDILEAALSRKIGGPDGELVEALGAEITRLRDEVKRLQTRLSKFDNDDHFFVTDIANRLPSELLPKKQTWSAMLSSVTKLKTERNNALCALAEFENPKNWTRPFSINGTLIREYALYLPKIRNE